MNAHKDPNHLFNELNEQAQQLMERFSSAESAEAIQGLSQAWTQLATSSWQNPAKWMDNLTELQRQQLNLWQSMMGLGEMPKDRRFKAEEWNDQPVYDFIKQSYLLTSDLLNQWAEAVPGD